MSIQTILPLRATVSTNIQESLASTSSKPFVREARTNISTPGVPARIKDGGPLMKWRNQVFEACTRTNMQPGERKTIMVAGTEMILRRTQTGDAYVLQKPEDSINAPFNGLYLNNKQEMRFNMELIEAGSTNNEANGLFREFSVAMGVPTGGVGF